MEPSRWHLQLAPSTCTPNRLDLQKHMLFIFWESSVDVLGTKDVTENEDSTMESPQAPSEYRGAHHIFNGL